MGHVVPNWDLDDSSDPARFDLLRHHSVATVPMLGPLGYEMTELTWENGQLSIHGLGPGPNATVETLEAIVDQATQKKQLPPPGKGSIDDLVPHNEEQQGDDDDEDDQAVHVPPLDPTDQRDDTCIAGSPVMKKPRITSPRVLAEKEESFQQSQQSGSVTRSRGDSRHVATVDTCEKESAWVGFETASLSSQGRTLSSSDNPDSTTNTNTINSACLTRQQDEESNEEDKKKGGARSSLSTKRSRAAASHSQSERKRRETINQKMKILQKMVPNSNKTDKASMLDEVIDHLKTLQAQLQMMMMMSRMSMSSMMMPFAMPQHQLPMPMMPHMGMGMDMNFMNPMMACHNLPGLSPVINPNAAFMPTMAPWDVTTGTDRSPSTPTMAPLDPSPYLAHFQPQPMTMEAYSKMVALIQQQQQQLASISKS